MTTYADVLAYVKSKARIVTSERDTDIGMSINEAYRWVVGSDLWDFLRVTTTQVLTAGTQDYALPAGFDKMCVESLRVYTTGTTYYAPVEFVTEPNADLWENYDSVQLPLAARIVAGATPGTRKLRLLPNFTAISQTLAYAYYAYPGDVSGTTTLGSPMICDAVAWRCLAEDKDWTRDVDRSEVNYERRSIEARKQARSSLYA